MHGKGTYCFSNGNRYEGEWEKDNMNGQGILYYANNDRYEGEWKDGNRHGEGKYYHYLTGKVDNGKWEYDLYAADSKQYDYTN